MEGGEQNQAGFVMRSPATSAATTITAMPIGFDGPLPELRKCRGRVNEADLIKEKVKAKARNTQTKHKSDDDKLAERRAANRLSAFQSRQRRKIIIESLQQRVSQLSREVEPLHQENAALRNLCVSLHQQNLQLQSQLQSVIGGEAPKTTTTRLGNGKQSEMDESNIIDMLLGELQKIRHLQGQLNKRTSGIAPSSSASA